MTPNKSNFLKGGFLIPGLITLIGIILLVFMMNTEGEPGAIPLLLIASGLIWFWTSRLGHRKKKS